MDSIRLDVPFATELFELDELWAEILRYYAARLIATGSSIVHRWYLLYFGQGGFWPAFQKSNDKRE